MDSFSKINLLNQNSKNYEVNTGNPIVAVVIRAPAKIKKGRKG